MMSDAERLKFMLDCRKQIEQYLSDCEILISILKRNLVEADRYMGYVFEHNPDLRHVQPTEPPPYRPVLEGPKVELRLDPPSRKGVTGPYLTEDEKTFIIGEYCKGRTMHSIYLETGRTINTIRKLLKSRGLETDTRYKKEGVGTKSPKDSEVPGGA